MANVDFRDQLTTSPGRVPVHCDNCSWRGTADQLEEIKDVQERLDPGGEVPAGQCPKCGALAYLNKTTVEQALDEAGILRDPAKHGSYVKFAATIEGTESPVHGPFLWVQITHQAVRGWRRSADNPQVMECVHLAKRMGGKWCCANVQPINGWDEIRVDVIAGPYRSQWKCSGCGAEAQLTFAQMAESGNPICTQAGCKNCDGEMTLVGDVR